MPLSLMSGKARAMSLRTEFALGPHRDCRLASPDYPVGPRLLPKQRSGKNPCGVSLRKIAENDLWRSWR